MGGNTDRSPLHYLYLLRIVIVNFQRGRVEMYNLGKVLREMYNGFLGTSYYAEEFKAFSTAYDRTLMSVQTLLAGMFPPEGFQVWDDRLPWQPIPVFTTHLDHTHVSCYYLRSVTMLHSNIYEPRLAFNIGITYIVINVI